MDLFGTLILDLSPGPFLGVCVATFAHKVPAWLQKGPEMASKWRPKSIKNRQKIVSAPPGAPTGELRPPGGTPPKCTENPLKLERTSSKFAAEYR